MKRLLSVILAIVIITGTVPFAVIPASAATMGYYEGLSYSVKKGEVTITNCSKDVEAIDIPSEIEGYPVTRIEGGAFQYCTYLTHVTIPEGVTSIGDMAFLACIYLDSINIPSTVTSIGKGIVGDCDYLYSLTVDSRNTTYYSENNCIITSADKILVAGCNGSIIPDDVTAIGDYGLYGCTGIKTITLPEGITSIGEAAFRGCEQLTSINIPSKVSSIGNSAFSWCKKLYSITIPEGITSIGDYMFQYCESISKVNIPSGVTSIGDYAFSNCYKLGGVVLPEGLTSIGKYSFSNSGILSLTLPESVLSIGDHAFQHSKITSITIPKGITSISDYTFYWCTSLESISIPESVTTIGDGAFNYCSRLTGISIPESVTTIGNEAFYDCEYLTGISIPGSVTTIGDMAFYNCVNLKSVIIPKSVESIGSAAFGYCYRLNNVYIEDLAAWYRIDFSNNTSNPLAYAGNLYLNGSLVTELVLCEEKIGAWAFFGCTSLTSLTISSGVELGKGAIGKCTSLESITVDEGNLKYYSTGNCIVEKETGTLVLAGNDYEIPSDGSVKAIGDYAFAYRTDITEISIPDGVTSIGDYAFSNCSNFKNIFIPDGVKTIGNGAFSGCGSLKTVSIPYGVTSIGDSAFRYCDLLEIVYYGGTRSDWYRITIGEENEYLLDSDIVLGFPIIEGDFEFFVDSTTNAVTLRKYWGTSTSVIIPEEIRGYPVTKIGENAFFANEVLKSVTIPHSIQTIGKDAFFACNALKHVYITDIGAWCCTDFQSTYANPLGEAANLYLDGELVTDVVIPDGVTSISPIAFLWYKNLKYITIPKTVTNIGGSAFEKCTGLLKVYYKGSPEDWENVIVDSVGNKEFIAKDMIYNYGTPMESFTYTTDDKNRTIMITGYEGNSTDLVIPSSYNGYIVRYMDPYAFEGRDDITSVVIPDTMWIIPEGAFKDCKNLRKVTISEGVRDIGDYAFSGCTAIAEIIIPESIEYIFMYAFNGCTSLEYVALPYTLCTIEYKAFYMCDSVARVTYNGSEERWKNIDIASGNAAIERAKIEFDTPPDVSVIIGDLNGDSEINAKDVNLIKQIIAGESPAYGEVLVFADINSDGEINAKDANLMKQIIAGKIQI